VIALLAGAFIGMSTLRIGGIPGDGEISFQQIVTLVMINSIWLTHGPDGVSRPPPHRRPVCSFLDRQILHFCVGCWRWSVMRLAISQTPAGRRCGRCANNELRPASRRFACSDHKGRPLVEHSVWACWQAGCSRRACLCQAGSITFAEFWSSRCRGPRRRRLANRNRQAALGLLILIRNGLTFLKSVRGFISEILTPAVIMIIRYMPDGIWGLFNFTCDGTLAVEGGPSRAAGPACNWRPRLSAAHRASVKGLSKHFGGLKSVDKSISMSGRRRSDADRTERLATTTLKRDLGL